MKKNNLKTKIIAAVLSVITVCSVGAMTVTSASAAETHVSTGTTFVQDNKIVMNDDMEAITKITSATLLKVLEETPYGKFIAPVIGGLLDTFIENTEDRIEKKVDELNDKVDKLFDKIDAAEASIKAEMTNDLGVQSFYNSFIKFKSLTEAMNKKMKEIYADKLSNAEKAAKLGSLTGNYSEWRAKFEDVLDELNNFCKKPSMTENGNIFELAYNHYTHSVLFSGEALDKAKPVCSYIMQVYTAGCATLVQSLSAQLYYNQLPAGAKAAVKPEYTAHLCRENKDITNEIQTVTALLAGKETGDKASTLKGMYDKVMHTERTIFVNKGHSNTRLSSELSVRSHQSNLADGKFLNTKGAKVADEFNGVFDKTVLDVANAKAIADYAKEKGVTVRKLLESNGFNTSKLPQNANLMTAKAFDDSVSKLSEAAGFNYQKAYYKGVNIDAKDAGETNVQILDCGYNSWKFSEWCYSVAGNACLLHVKAA